MSAQLPVPIPPGITPGGKVTPSTELEVKSLGVGTTAPATADTIAIGAQTSTPTYDTPALVHRKLANLYMEVGGGPGTTGNLVVLPYRSGTGSNQVAIGQHVTLINSAGTVVVSLSSTGVVAATTGYATSSPRVDTTALTSGVAHRYSTVTDVTVHILLEAGTAAGTAKITMGPAAAGTTHVVATGLKLLAGSSQLVTVRLPVSWYIVVTVTTATIVSALAVS